MEQLSLLEYTPPAIIARNAALEQVETNNLDWSALALIQFKQLFIKPNLMPLVLNLTGEHIRHYLKPHVGSPSHHNAWGAFTMKLLRTGLIEKTGEYVPMEDKRSHARITPVYRILR